MAGGHLALPVVIVVAAVAAVCGDTIGYLAGRRGGRALLLRDGWGATNRRHAVRRADRFFARYGAATVFVGRWIPGLRVVAAVMAGGARMPWPRFAVATPPARSRGPQPSRRSPRSPATGSLLLAGAGLTVAGIGMVAAWRAQRRTAERRS